jgi:hypothetical protein
LFPHRGLAWQGRNRDYAVPGYPKTPFVRHMVIITQAIQKRWISNGEYINLSHSMLCKQLPLSLLPTSGSFESSIILKAQYV